MKALFISLLISSSHNFLMAREINPADNTYMTPNTDLISSKDYNQDMKIIYLNKLLNLQQKAYDDKITFLENELQKTKEHLLSKSMNQEKMEEAMIEKYSVEASYLKKELAYKTKTLLEYQRQMEKLKPTEDLRNLIKINTKLASELRRSEDQIATITQSIHSEGRLPASVKDSK
ncbi:MAG: hypothetical protein Q7U04_03470 [Bacteriovorax sp.]|nr:hypothetical protein [Bacteriovorax sp.]